MLGNISGMVNFLNAQQTKIDTIANNIANINSTAYKKNRVAFGDVLYHTVYGPGMPVSDSVRCGSGAMVSGTEKDFSSGQLYETGRKLDLAVDGDGFFGVMLPDGTLGYTREGNFYLDGEQFLVNGQGAPIYTDMLLPEGYTELKIAGNGEITAKLSDGQWITAGSIPLFHVPNPAGLEAVGRGMYRETEASGTILQGEPGNPGFGTLKQGYLERSNVDLGEEMVNLIVAQKSFQFSCQALRTLDDMWGVANNLQR
jgi:flagellar basal-body rod protein FlgG